jgi:hypothetical protein
MLLKLSDPAGTSSAPRWSVEGGCFRGLRINCGRCV